MREEGGKEEFGLLERQLGVIRIAVEMDVIIMENIAKGKEVNHEEKGPQDSALGHTSGDKGQLGTERLKLDELSVALEIRFKPVSRGVSDTDGD